MKFTKLNENSIRCVISQDEMTEYGVNLDDLMDDREKAEDFLRVILDEAKTEVDFHTSGEALNVQLSIMPDGDIALMISDDQNSAIRAMLSQFKDKLKDFSELINEEKEKKENLHKKGTTEVKPYEPVPFDQVVETTKEVLESAAEDDPLEMTLWSEFDNLDDCVRLAKALRHLGDAKSMLFKFDDHYFLSMTLVQTKRQMAKNVFAVAEFSNQVFNDADLAARLNEHGQLILDGHALRDLQEL
ncbi:MAG: adaptor protein MecA [Lachnospiraceae bacterium]|nr:adaptor protein MecA [Lachnospiraceae bacterium]